MEKAITKYIRGKLKKAELISLFDQPVEKGGFNLYHQTASKLGENISQLVKNVQIFKTEAKTESELTQRTRLVHSYLVEKYNLNLTYDQHQRLDQFLSDRFSFKLPENRFNQKIDQPWGQGGLGLNKRTVKKITREIKLIMFNKKFKENES
jgi:hypothetical protein